MDIHSVKTKGTSSFPVSNEIFGRSPKTFLDCRQPADRPCVELGSIGLTTCLPDFCITRPRVSALERRKLFELERRFAMSRQLKQSMICNAKVQIPFT